MFLLQVSVSPSSCCPRFRIASGWLSCMRPATLTTPRFCTLRSCSRGGVLPAVHAQQPLCLPRSPRGAPPVHRCVRHRRARDPRRHAQERGASDRSGTYRFKCRRLRQRCKGGADCPQHLRLSISILWAMGEVRCCLGLWLVRARSAPQLLACFKRSSFVGFQKAFRDTRHSQGN